MAKLTVNRRRERGRTGAKVIWVLGTVGLGLLGFAAGRWSAPTYTAAEDVAVLTPLALLVQATPENDPRELLPLPGNPGQGPGGQAQPGEGECPVYLYQDGQLFEFGPGQLQPGQPGPGGSPELFPLQPPGTRPGPSRPQPPLFDSDDVVQTPVTPLFVSHP